jgi:hypothetical protein
MQWGGIEGRGRSRSPSGTSQAKPTVGPCARLPHDGPRRPQPADRHRDRVRRAQPRLLQPVPQRPHLRLQLQRAGASKLWLVPTAVRRLCCRTPHAPKLARIPHLAPPRTAAPLTLTPTRRARSLSPARPRRPRRRRPRRPRPPCRAAWRWCWCGRPARSPPRTAAFCSSRRRVPSRRACRWVIGSSNSPDTRPRPRKRYAQGLPAGRKWTVEKAMLSPDIASSKRCSNGLPVGCRCRHT